MCCVLFRAVEEFERRRERSRRGTEGGPVAAFLKRVFCWDSMTRLPKEKVCCSSFSASLSERVLLKRAASFAPGCTASDLFLSAAEFALCARRPAQEGQVPLQRRLSPCSEVSGLFSPNRELVRALLPPVPLARGLERSAWRRRLTGEGTSDPLGVSPSLSARSLRLRSLLRDPAAAHSAGDSQFSGERSASSSSALKSKTLREGGSAASFTLEREGKGDGPKRKMASREPLEAPAKQLVIVDARRLVQRANARLKKTHKVIVRTFAEQRQLPPSSSTQTAEVQAFSDC